MNNYILLSNIVLSILDTSYVDHMIQIKADEFQSIESKMELFNAVLIPHQKRYINCYESSMCKKEEDNFSNDYKAIFIDGHVDFIDLDTAIAIFRFISTYETQSIYFREVCVNLVDNLKLCQVKEIVNSMCSKIIHRIIGSALYGVEPYDSLLRDSTALLQQVVQDVDTSKYIGVLE